MYIIQVKEKYGHDMFFRPEQAITKGKSFSFKEAHRKRKLMQSYTNSLIYKVKKEQNNETKRYIGRI